MGNVALCAPSLSSNNNAIKVLSSDGNLTVYTKSPLRAADIMVENPGQFVCESGQLVVGQRIVGVNAEEELERGEVYFLLPMEILYSVLTDEEMKCMNHYRGMKQAGVISFSKSVFHEFCLFPSTRSDSDSELRGATTYEQGSELNSTAMFKESYLSKRSYSWRPELETIVETPPRTT